MNHPATAELFEFMDNRLGKQRVHEIELHLAGCVHCRRRIEFERSTRHSVRSEPLAKAPERLTALVMVNVGAPARDPLVFRILGKLGSIVAMIVVLAVIGFAISQMSSLSEQSGTSSPITQIVAPVSEAYANGMAALVKRTATITQAIENTGDVQFWRTLLIITLILAVLVGADRVIGKRFIKLRP